MIRHTFLAVAFVATSTLAAAPVAAQHAHLDDTAGHPPYPFEEVEVSSVWGEATAGGAPNSTNLQGTARIGVVVDWELFQALGTRQAAEAFVRRVIGNVSDVWEAQFEVNLVLHRLHVFESPNDPFGATTAFCSSYENARWWATNGMPVVDALVLFSGRPVTSGALGSASVATLGLPLVNVAGSLDCPTIPEGGVWVGPHLSVMGEPSVAPGELGPVGGAEFLFGHEMGHIGGVADHTFETCPAGTPVDRTGVAPQCGVMTPGPPPPDGGSLMGYPPLSAAVASYGAEGQYGHHSEEVRDRIRAHLEETMHLLQPVEAPVEPCPTSVVELSGADVRLCWKTPSGQEGVGRIVTQSSDSAVLWFFREGNWEVIIKVLNACSNNGHVWVFFAAVTNVELRLTVVLNGEEKTYLNPMGQSADAVTDTQAFPCD